jgi:hypothetical protein
MGTLKDYLIDKRPVVLTFKLIVGISPRIISDFRSEC